MNDFAEAGGMRRENPSNHVAHVDGLSAVLVMLDDDVGAPQESLPRLVAPIAAARLHGPVGRARAVPGATRRNPSRRAIATLQNEISPGSNIANRTMVRFLLMP